MWILLPHPLLITITCPASLLFASSPCSPNLGSLTIHVLFAQSLLGIQKVLSIIRHVPSQWSTALTSTIIPPPNTATPTLLQQVAMQSHTFICLVFSAIFCFVSFSFFPSLIHLLSGLIFDTKESMVEVFGFFFFSFVYVEYNWSVKEIQVSK